MRPGFYSVEPLFEYSESGPLKWGHPCIQATSKCPKVRMLPSANPPLKWGHPSNQDTLTGPKVGRIRGSPLYMHIIDSSLVPRLFSKKKRGRAWGRGYNWQRSRDPYTVEPLYTPWNNLNSQDICPSNVGHLCNEDTFYWPQEVRYGYLKSCTIMLSGRDQITLIMELNEALIGSEACLERPPLGWRH